MFEPLRDTVSLLTKFSITMTDVVLKQLEEGPLAWKSLKKKMFQRCPFSHIYTSLQQQAYAQSSASLVLSRHLLLFSGCLPLTLCPKAGS